MKDKNAGVPVEVTTLSSTATDTETGETRIHAVITVVKVERALTVTLAVGRYNLTAKGYSDETIDNITRRIFEVEASVFPAGEYVHNYPLRAIELKTLLCDYFNSIGLIVKS